MEELKISQRAQQIFQSHEMIMTLHAKAIACSCECLGMASENQLCALVNQSPAYVARDFRLVMEKWGLIDKEENPKI